MKEKADLMRSWLRKAESDQLALDAALGVGALDAACFHAQQAAEKYLKAFLTYRGIDFPHTHNLSKLVEQCAQVEPSFRELLPTVEPLTPYAVEVRYDAEFWPSREAAEAARQSALSLRDCVLAKLPKENPRAK
jgi:HEPN domain-containing protein